MTRWHYEWKDKINLVRWCKNPHYSHLIVSWKKDAWYLKVVFPCIFVSFLLFLPVKYWRVQIIILVPKGKIATNCVRHNWIFPDLFFLQGKLALNGWELFVPYGKLSYLRFKFFSVEVVEGGGMGIICLVLETSCLQHWYLINKLSSVYKKRSCLLLVLVSAVETCLLN